MPCREVELVRRTRSVGEHDGSERGLEIGAGNARVEAARAHEPRPLSGGQADRVIAGHVAFAVFATLGRHVRAHGAEKTSGGAERQP